MQQQPHGSRGNADVTMLNYRIAELERNQSILYTQMQKYLTQQEYELKQQLNQQKIESIANDVKDLNKLVIWIVRGLFSGVGAIVIGIAVVYFTHLP